ncbi:MAG: DUF2798 domain-containing protein [Methylophilaceae bacterium]
MAIKITYRYHMFLFALIMSASAALTVSGIIIYLHFEGHTGFMVKWFTAFFTAWPIVFIAILTIAPFVNRLLDLFVEEFQ